MKITDFKIGDKIKRPSFETTDYIVLNMLSYITNSYGNAITLTANDVLADDWSLYGACNTPNHIAYLSNNCFKDTQATHSLAIKLNEVISVVNGLIK